MNIMDLGIVAVTHLTEPRIKREGTAKREKMSLDAKKKRIRHELLKAGMPSYRLAKFNMHYLPKIIKDDEHIHGIVYGRHSEGSGLLNWVDRAIVATDHRVISFNHKPGYTDNDQFTYDVINGVDASTAGPFTAITLDTRLGPVTVRFVRKKCAEIFIQYVKKRRLAFFKTRTTRELQPGELGGLE